MDYPKPALTVDAVVLAGQASSMCLLVVERRNNPFKGDLALPGGFVNCDELPFFACLRELREETGLVLPARQALPLQLRARKDRDPRGWTLSQPFLFHLATPLAVKAGDDARSARWVPLVELQNLAFDHGAILCEALGRFWNAMPTRTLALANLVGFGEPEHWPEDITFYGGSFNPLHQGHLACIAGFPKPEQLVVVPDSNPFKQGTQARCYWRLYRHLRASLEEGQAVFPGYCGMELPNPSLDWLPHVRAKSVGLLLGEDSLVDLPTWTEASTLIKAIQHLFVVPRRSQKQAVHACLGWLASINPQLRMVKLADHPWRDLSSAQLRAQQGDGK